MRIMIGDGDGSLLFSRDCLGFVMYHRVHIIFEIGHRIMRAIRNFIYHVFMHKREFE